MSRKKRKNTSKNKTPKAKPTTAFGIRLNRRNLIKFITAGIIAVPVYGALSAYNSHQKQVHDLTIIGQGKPVLVQAHDVTCPQCRTLLASVKSVIDDFPDVEFKIADLKSHEGHKFASKHGARKVTLLMFNAKGRRVDMVAGLQTQEQVRSFIEKSL